MVRKARYYYPRFRKKWNRMSLGRAAVLFSRGGTKKEVVEHYWKHYGKKLGFRSRVQLSKYLFLKENPTVPNFESLFQNRGLGTIRKNFSRWLEASRKRSERIAKSKQGKPSSETAKRKISESHRKLIGGIQRQLAERGITTATDWREKRGRRKILAQQRTPEKEFLWTELNVAIRRAMDDLNPVQKRIVNEVFYEGRTLPSIARSWKRPLASIRSILRGAMEDLSKNPELVKLAPKTRG